MIQPQKFEALSTDKPSHRVEELNWKFVLRHIWKDRGEIDKYQAVLVLFGNEENGICKDRFPRMFGYTIANRATYMRSWQGSELNHTDLDNPLPDPRLDRLDYLELRKHM